MPGAACLGRGVATHDPERLLFDIAPDASGECALHVLSQKHSGRRRFGTATAGLSAVARSAKADFGQNRPESGPVTCARAGRPLSDDLTIPVPLPRRWQSVRSLSQAIAAYLPKKGWGGMAGLGAPSRQIAPNQTLGIDSPDIHSSACFRFSPPFPLVAARWRGHK
jgi:hypothetical protein